MKHFVLGWKYPCERTSACDEPCHGRHESYTNETITFSHYLISTWSTIHEITNVPMEIEVYLAQTNRSVPSLQRAHHALMKSWLPPPTHRILTIRVMNGKTRVSFLKDIQLPLLKSDQTPEMKFRVFVSKSRRCWVGLEAGRKRLQPDLAARVRVHWRGYML